MEISHPEKVKITHILPKEQLDQRMKLHYILQKEHFASTLVHDIFNQSELSFTPVTSTSPPIYTCSTYHTQMHVQKDKSD